MDTARLEALGRLLAERHRDAVEPEPERSLLNYAESSRVGDWSMRSALVRFAQPEPERAAALLELVRRLDVVLGHVARRLEKHTVLCDRALGLDSISEVGGRELALVDPVDPCPDTRAVDLARLARAAPEEFPTVLMGYTEVGELEPEERNARPLLEVALDLDELAETLAEWAHTYPGDPPAETVDSTCSSVRARLDELGVPVETGPPPGRGRGRGQGV